MEKFLSSKENIVAIILEPHHRGDVLVTFDLDTMDIFWVHHINGPLMLPIHLGESDIVKLEPTHDGCIDRIEQLYLKLTVSANSSIIGIEGVLHI